MKYILKKKISERTINERYFISNGTRWKRQIEILINLFEQDFDNTYSKVIKIFLNNN